MEQEFQDVLQLGKSVKKKLRICFLCTSIPFCNHKAICQINNLVNLLGGDLCSYGADNIQTQILESNPE